MTHSRESEEYGLLPWLSAGVLIFVIIAFLRPYFARFQLTDLAHHVHSLFCFAWLCLLILQPILIRMGRTNTHRVMGYVSPLIALGIIWTGWHMITVMIPNVYNFSAEVAHRLAIMDLGLSVTFMICYVLGMRYRSSPRLHIPWMVSTIFPLLLPAVIRMRLLLPIRVEYVAFLNISYYFIYFLIIMAIIWKKKDKRAVRIFLIVLFLLLVQQVIMFLTYKEPWMIQWLDNIARM